MPKGRLKGLSTEFILPALYLISKLKAANFIVQPTYLLDSIYIFIKLLKLL
jgi:hypothetical protein